MSHINLWAVLVCVIASAILGAIWYSPMFFLREWTRAVGREPSQSPDAYLATFLSTVVAVFAFAYWLGPDPALTPALSRGLLAGAGLVAPSLAVNYAFANRRMSLWLIDGGYHTARFLLFGLILGLWH